MSKIIPNTFQCFNAYIDRAMQHLNDSELRVLMFATRHILGWQDKINSRRGNISLGMFENGFTVTGDDGTTTEYGGCGLGEAAIRAACKSLVEFGLLEKIGFPTEHGQEWRLGDSPVWEKLEQRTRDIQEKRHKQTEKAKVARCAQLKGVSLNNTPLLSDNTPPVSLDNTPPVSLDDTQQSHVQSHVQSHDPAPENGTELVSATPTLTVLPKSKSNPMYDAIKAVWKYTAALNTDMAKMLTGKATKKGWKEYNITPAMTPDEVIAWAAWYRRTELKGNPDLNMLANHAGVQSSVYYWRETEAKKREVIPTVAPDETYNLPSADDYLPLDANGRYIDKEIA